MKDWYQITNEADKPAAEIMIYDRIGPSTIGNPGVGAKDFASALKEIPRNRPVTVRINSPGGNVSDGLAIYNLLKERQGITCIVDGYALSAASVVALGGTELRMPKNALLMIHDPMASADGNAEDMRQAADMLDKHRDALATIYQAKTGAPLEEIKLLMAAETWFTGEEAKAYKFADTVTDEITVTASFDLSKFRNAPRVVDSKPNVVRQEKNSMNVQEFKTVIAQALGIGSQDAVALAEAALAEAKKTISTVTAELEKAKADLAKSVTDHAAALAALEADVEKRANAKAGELARKQGVPPVKDENIPGNSDILAELDKVKDPTQRVLFYRKNKSAIDAAFSALPRN